MEKTVKIKNNLILWMVGFLEGRHWIYLAAIVLSSLGSAVISIIKAKFVEIVVSSAQIRTTEGLYLDVAVNFLLLILFSFIWRFGIVHYNTEGWKGVAAIEKQIFAKALRLPYAYYEQHHSGQFLSKLVYDTQKTGDIFSSRLRRFLSALICVVAYLIPMFIYNAQLTFFLILLCVSLASLNGFLAAPMKRAGKRLSEESASITEKLTNLLSGMEVIKMLPAGKKLLEDYQQQNEKYFRTQKKINRMTALLQSSHYFFEMISMLAFLGIGMYFVSKGKISLGALAAMYTLYGAFQYALLDAGTYLPQLMYCMGNAQKLRDFLSEEEQQKKDLMVKEKMPENIAVNVNKISFGYADNREILHEFSMQVKAGSCVAITGESGCGKSTLAKLLLGFYSPNSGTIQLAGEIAYVPQEPYLYQVSIAENIAYGKGCEVEKEVPMDEVIAAAQIANAHDFIMKFPQGYQTVVDERGNTLSGGERQRIAIARAVLKGAPILLLDEATSALDNESEKLVNEAIRKISKEHTTIMIAHRKSTIDMADEIWKL